VAENLARLGESVTLITAIGDDSPGVRVKNRLLDAKIDISHLVVSSGYRTASYLALFDDHHNPVYAIDDMTVMATITPDLIERKKKLIQNARLIMIDSNLPEPTIETIIDLAQARQVPIVADPTSVSLGIKLKPHLKKLRMVTPNAAEAAVLSGQKITSRQSALQAANKLVKFGVEVAVITLAERGVVYATDDTSGHIPALTTTVVNLTGAADALTGTVIFGILNDIPIDEAVRLGATAAALTLQSEESVLKHLTLDGLYDHL
jgi:pseudouridine kinase